MYDLDALKKDMEQVDKEIKVFKEMLMNLMQRKIKLQALIEEAEKRKLDEEAKLKMGPGALVPTEASQEQDDFKIVPAEG